jgi:hypothetical protein
MKIIKHFIFTFCLLASFGAQAQSLNDNFNGSSVNASLWNVILPFAQSQIIESGGSLTTKGRGTLATVAGFDFPITISGTVTLNNSNEHFETVLRTDLSVWPPDANTHELTGINVVFSADGSQVSIQQFTLGQLNPIMLALASFSFTVGQTYNFVISDDKTNIALSINGTQILSGISTFASGNKIAFDSREFSTTSSSLDFINIQSLPVISLIKSVKPSFSYLALGTNYQLQVSSDLITWTNQGSAFTATNSNMIYPQYFDVNNWNQLFFRLQVSQ